MNEELLNFYENCKLGVAVYKRLSKNNYEFVYYNPSGRVMDGVEGIDIVGKKVHDVFPNVFEFGLLDVFEKVHDTGDPLEMPIKGYVVDNKTTLYRTNRVQKLSCGLIVSVYSDESKLFSYINKIEDENEILSRALDYTSHNLRGDLSTSLGVFELFETVDVSPEEKYTLLRVVKENLEKIDTKIHRLVRLLSKGISVNN
ncbi:hypothetical protein [Flammeovirga sp. SJP92]|uniref:hypothetical protein n=1 Tax=Flammeovirga sp. SJP92 TaxID=1775430 RepID=UPI000788ADB1|nr:hypothetical protein [Flammeovirga sp. SJP92]KXX67376.1 hypothetical protein AVL50_27145 [Flammeovirga sp. SJP92]